MAADQLGLILNVAVMTHGWIRLKFQCCQARAQLSGQVPMGLIPTLPIAAFRIYSFSASCFGGSTSMEDGVRQFRNSEDFPRGEISNSLTRYIDIVGRGRTWETEKCGTLDRG